MKATAIEFRLRMWIMVAVIVLGYWAPWIEAWGVGQRMSTLAWLPMELSRLGVASFATASAMVIVLGALVAAVGMILRIWGSAYLGYDTVHHEKMQAGGMMADGPYRYVRNPLYLGSWCMMAAMALLMPPTGALFAMVLLTIFLLRLILGEEAFLSGKLGEPYREYLRTTPRLIPRLRGALPAAGDKPQWMTAALGELNAVGIFITLAVLSWSYDHMLMMKGVLISFGASLVVRAVMKRDEADASVA
jgi:protein-S-isoprenylcysteine O-methyltransferase Ste14